MAMRRDDRQLIDRQEIDAIIRASEAELYFYSRLFGFTPADDIEPVTIENLPTA